VSAPAAPCESAKIATVTAMSVCLGTRTVSGMALSAATTACLVNRNPICASVTPRLPEISGSRPTGRVSAVT
jgi:hypothetical protein